MGEGGTLNTQKRRQIVVETVCMYRLMDGNITPIASSNSCNTSNLLHQ